MQRSDRNSDLEELIDARERLHGDWPTSERELDEIYGGAMSREAPLPAPLAEPNASRHQVNDPATCASHSLAARRLRNYRLFYRQSTGKSHVDVRRLVSEIYLSMFRSLPEDHVVIDPVANAEFVTRCRRAGAEVGEYVLNSALLNARKAGWHSGIRREVVPSLDRKVKEESGHACEIALRLVSDEHSIAHGTPLSLDKILCHPKWRGKFDAIAASLSPTQDSFVHRLVALSLRKDSRRLSTRVVSTNCAKMERFGRLDAIMPERDLDPCAAIYLLHYHHGALYAGFSWNIQERVHLHLKYGGANVVPHSLWEQKLDGVELLLAPFRERFSVRAAALELRNLKREHRPRLNFVA